MSPAAKGSHPLTPSTLLDPLRDEALGGYGGLRER